MTRTHLGEMLTLYRAARRWTVRDVAPRIGISAATVSRIERGHAMDADTMLRVWRWLLGDTEQSVENASVSAAVGTSEPPQDS